MSKKKKSENRFKSGEVKEIVLSVIGLSIVLGGTFFISPGFPIAIGGLMKLIEDTKNIKVSKSKVKKILKKLEEKEIISIEEYGDEVTVNIKDKWNTTLVKYSIKALFDLKKKKEWDGRWYLVVFDVPEEQRNKRYYLRKFLNDIGFYKYQQSVYVFPYKCEDEITLIKKIIEGGRYLNYIVAESIDKEEDLKIFFNLKSSQRPSQRV